MNDPKAVALFQEIVRKTQAGKLPWQETADENKLIASMLGKYTLVLLTQTGGWGEPTGPPSLSVLDDKDKTLMEINHKVDGIDESAMESLVVFARRTALNADPKLDELLAELQKDDDIPF